MACLNYKQRWLTTAQKRKACSILGANLLETCHDVQ